VSGLDIGSEHYNEASLQMLVEYLSGELVEKTSDNDALKISRLVLVGNSVASSNLAITLDSTFEPTERKPVRALLSSVVCVCNNEVGPATQRKGADDILEASRGSIIRPFTRHCNLDASPCLAWRD
jgi:hypothetical protein